MFNNRDTMVKVVVWLVLAGLLVTVLAVVVPLVTQ